MRFLTSDKCRVCKRTFCCTSCKDAHETSKHNFFAECDICKYGQIVLSSTHSKVLLDHLKTFHFPLRCDLCKRAFDTIDDVVQHIKCPEANTVQAKDDRKSPKTPAQISYETNFDSPPLTNLLTGKNVINNKNMVSLATSTPMHQGGGNLEKVQEVIITPVESTENTKISILKNPNSQCHSSKRVTFCGTPFFESSHRNYRKPKNMVMEGTPMGMTISPSTFYSAKIEQTTNLDSPPVLVKTSAIIVEEIQANQKPENNEEEPKEVLNISCEHEDNTVWTSALNISVEICSDEDEHGDNQEIENKNDKEDEEHDKDGKDKEQTSEPEDKLQGIRKTNFATPVTPKIISRKISIVKPTPAKKEKKEEQLFVDMIQTFSTPNVPRTIQSSAHAMFAHGDSNPSVSNIYGAGTTDAVITLNENIAQTSAPAELKFEDSISQPNETYDIDCMTSDTSIPKGNTIWTSVSNILSNIFHNFSGVDASYEDRANRSLKRCSSDNDLLEPLKKRCKFTDIKCRRPIRKLPPLEISNDLQINIRVNITEGTKKIYVDKATITEESLFANR